MGGKMDKGLGTAKEHAGKISGSERLEAEGKAQKIKGQVKEGAESLKETWKGTRDGMKD